MKLISRASLKPSLTLEVCSSTKDCLEQFHFTQATTRERKKSLLRDPILQLLKSVEEVSPALRSLFGKYLFRERQRERLWFQLIVIQAIKSPIFRNDSRIRCRGERRVGESD